MPSGVYIHSKIQREEKSKIAKAKGFGKWMRGKHQTEKTKRKRGKTLKEKCQKLREETGRGRPLFTEKWKQNIGKAMMGKRESKKHRENIGNALRKERIKMICQTCGDEILILPSQTKGGRGKFCSPSCSAIWYMKHSKKKNTSIEIKTEKYLKKIGLNYQAQKFIKEGKTIADFYIPAQRIVIYCDGTYWHSIPKVRKRDATQDLLLGMNGYKVIRLPEKDIKNENFRKLGL